MTVNGLYAITPDCSDTASLLKQVEAAIGGGAQILQYRNKTAEQQLRLQQAGALRALCRTYGILFIVNDDVELAAAVKADGVHLGVCDATVAGARARIGENKIIGVSCYADLQRAHEVATQGANYVAFGSFFTSPTKPNAVRPALDLLRQARHQLALPLVAIGGIDLHNARSVIAAGADAVAVLSGLFEADDIAGTAREFRNLFTLESHDFA
jgi:thiamine-phosphate pyrophosphorylase